MTQKAAARITAISSELHALSETKVAILMREGATYEELDSVSAQIQSLEDESRALHISGGHKRKPLESERAELVAANRD